MNTGAVSASDRDNDPKAVGPTVYLAVTVGGVPVDAMVDTGSQSTIISRALLHAIGDHAKKQGKPLPVLERPTVRLYGKDGPGGGHELVVTAQLQTTIEADGESVCVPVFVQPQSEQPCLLGMNALPALGLTLTHANGEPLIVKGEPNCKVAHVRLVQSVTLPSLKGRFLKVQAESSPSSLKLTPGCPVLFEPHSSFFEPLGLCTHESLVTVQDDGCMWYPYRIQMVLLCALTKVLNWV